MSEEERLESIELYLVSINEIAKDISFGHNKGLMQVGATMITNKSESALNIVRKLRDSNE